MKHALISPNETVYSYDGSPIGQRIAETTSTPFEIAEPLFWTEVSDEVEADRFYWDGQAALPVPTPPEPIIEEEEIIVPQA